MYVPRAFEMADRSVVVDRLRSVPFGHLITSADGLDATPVPFVVDDELTEARAHLARANGHWRAIDGTDALLLVPTADAYISPNWYPTKATSAEVVPTWNYEVVHLHGRVEIVEDRKWLLEIVTALTDLNEAGVAGRVHSPWQVTDAPSGYIDKMLAGIVGVRLQIDRFEAKRKLSQNKPDADRQGAAEGLEKSGGRLDREVASLMREADT